MPERGHSSIALLLSRSLRFLLEGMLGGSLRQRDFPCFWLPTSLASRWASLGVAAGPLFRCSHPLPHAAEPTHTDAPAGPSQSFVTKRARHLFTFPVQRCVRKRRRQYPSQPHRSGESRRLQGRASCLSVGRAGRARYSRNEPVGEPIPMGFGDASKPNFFPLHVQRPRPYRRERKRSPAPYPPIRIAGRGISCRYPASNLINRREREIPRKPETFPQRRVFSPCLRAPESRPPCSA